MHPVKWILAPFAAAFFVGVIGIVHAQQGGGAGAETAATRLGVATPADPASVERGATTFGSSCAFCHGGDARGAQGPDLTRSLFVLDDSDGKVLGDFLKVGRPETGMPSFAQIPDAQIKDLASFLRSRAMSEANRRPTMNPASIVVGDPVAGEAYFNGGGGASNVSFPVGDLKGVGSKYNAVILRGVMFNPRVITGGGAAPLLRGRSDSGQGHAGIRPAVSGTLCRLTISSSRSSTPMSLGACLNGRSAAICRRSRSTIRSRPIDSRCSSTPTRSCTTSLLTW
jgi:mono/diheme cytochrome c family protein